MPTHRGIFHRVTGRPIGPPVPIYPEDWPYSDISPSEILWRYMDFWKFEDLLTKSALYFSRADLLPGDPLEGRFSPANKSVVSRSDDAFYAAYPISRTLEQAEAQHEVHRHCVFVLCWHRNTKESRKMWNAYTSTTQSIVITSSAKALNRFIPEEIEKSPVKYHNEDFPRTEFNYNTIYFYKPLKYSFENEFRLLRSIGKNESVSFDDPKDFKRYVPISLKAIVHRVITHPNASKDFKLKVDELIGKYLKSIKRENSHLL